MAPLGYAAYSNEVSLKKIRTLFYWAMTGFAKQLPYNPLSNFNKELFLPVKALFAILRPADIHFLIMILDKIGNLSYLAVVENAPTLKDRVTIALNKELCRTSFGK